MIKISVIIPVYNTEKYIKECLDSIANQTFNDFEVICVNDGSVDNSLNILDEYAQRDSRFIIITQKNQGAGPARNNGLKQAKGEYVLFLDSDDVFEPTMLEEMYNKIQEFDADLAVCSCKKMNEKGEIIEDSNPQWPLKLDIVPLNTTFSRKDYPEDILWMLCVIPWNKLCKKEILIKNNIEFQNITSSNDVAFGHKVIVCAQKIVVFDRKLIKYRYHHKESISNTRAEHTINIIHSAQEVKNFLVQKNLYKTLENAFIKAYKNHIRSEISLCDNRQYKKFLNEFETLYPEFLETFHEVLKCDFITLEYLYNFIGNKQVYLWGASNFLKKILEAETNANSNILGIIDKNQASWGKYFGNYKIYSPSILEKHPADVLVTIYNDYESVYSSVKQELSTDYPKISILDNIFKRENRNTKV